MSAGPAAPEYAAPDDGAPPAAAATPQPALAALLADEPTALAFFQAVRALERVHPARDPVGRFGDPAREVARFAASTSLAFPTAEIESVDPPADGAGPPRMTVSFMGLTGPLGLFPVCYTAHVGERERGKDTALRDFLDLFNHRALSLFYRAWDKYRFAAACERGADDRLAEHALDLIGMGTAGLAERAGVPREALVFYSGLFALGARPAEGLRQLLADYFGVPVAVEQFVGGWHRVERGSQCAVGDDAPIAGELGVGALVGDEVWDQQARIRVRLGPLTRRQYDDFLPTGSAHAPLRALARLYCNDEVDVEFQLVLARDEVPGCVLGAEPLGGSPPLGWCTWLRTVTPARDPDDAVLAG